MNIFSTLLTKQEKETSDSDGNADDEGKKDTEVADDQVAQKLRKVGQRPNRLAARKVNVITRFS